MSMVHNILVLNGPNLNLLGTREPEVYGATTLEGIEKMLKSHAGKTARIDFRQSNHEGELVDWIQSAAGNQDGILLNAGAYTHTSVAIHDALRAVGLPVVELHLSNVFAREDFRHHSHISALAVGVVCGFGATSYRLALDGIIAHLKRIIN